MRLTLALLIPLASVGAGTDVLTGDANGDPRPTIRGGTAPTISFPEALRPARSLEDLSWIEGHWSGEAFGGQAEENWIGPAGASMTGIFRLVQNGEAVMYELLLLELDADGEIYYRFKHVGRGWEPWEETRLEYRLTELEGRKATFRSTSDEPPSNAPAWFTYESASDDRLTVTIYGGDSPIALEMTRR